MTFWKMVAFTVGRLVQDRRVALAPYDGDRPANYVSWWDNRALPVFNHDNPNVREYLMEVAEYWLKLGIDGWRLDVPNEITTPGFGTSSAIASKRLILKPILWEKFGAIRGNGWMVPSLMA